MRRALLCLCVAAGAAHAEPATVVVTAEGGAEADTNVQRAETGEGIEAERVSSAVIRLGARLDRRGKLAKGALLTSASVLARLVRNDDASPENVALVSGDARWVRPLGTRPIAAGVGVAYIDALPISHEVGARTFRVIASDAILVARDGDRRTLTLTAGPRYFVYKPQRDYDWWGPALTARLDLKLWEPSGGARSLELVAILGFEARIYDRIAYANDCPPGGPIDPEDSCFARTSFFRRDRYHRAGVELTYTGSFIATAGYQVTITDSNSYGFSIVRHRGTLSATRPLPAKLIGTVLATLQIDRYLDRGALRTEFMGQDFTSLEDANRSSLQLRLARQVTAAWAVEGRGAIWRDIGNTFDTEYKRELVYLGAVYSK
jgi:hypothetical protein